MQEIFEEVSSIIDAGLNSVITNPDIVLLNIGALIVTAIVVRKFFWSKITAFLDKQQQTLTEALQEAEALKKEAIHLQENAKAEYQKMREETKKLKQNLEKEAKIQAEALLLQAEKDANKKLEQAEKQIAFDVSQAQEDIKQSIKSIAFTAARKIVSKEIDEETHQHLIDEVIQEGLKHES